METNIALEKWGSHEQTMFWQDDQGNWWHDTTAIPVNSIIGTILLHQEDGWIMRHMHPDHILSEEYRLALHKLPRNRNALLHWNFDRLFSWGVDMERVCERNGACNCFEIDSDADFDPGTTKLWDDTVALKTSAAKLVIRLGDHVLREEKLAAASLSRGSFLKTIRDAFKRQSAGGLETACDARIILAAVPDRWNTDFESLNMKSVLVGDELQIIFNPIKFGNVNGVMALSEPEPEADEVVESIICTIRDDNGDDASKIIWKDKDGDWWQNERRLGDGINAAKRIMEFKNTGFTMSDFDPDHGIAEPLRILYNQEPGDDEGLFRWNIKPLTEFIVTKKQNQGSRLKIMIQDLGIMFQDDDGFTVLGTTCRKMMISLSLYLTHEENLDWAWEEQMPEADLRSLLTGYIGTATSGIVATYLGERTFSLNNLLDIFHEFGTSITQRTFKQIAHHIDAPAATEITLQMKAFTKRDVFYVVFEPVPSSGLVLQ